MPLFRQRAMFPLRFACFAAVVLVGASSSSVVAVDWSAKQRQSDRDLALFHAMEGKVLHSGPDNPAAGGSPEPHNFGARSETPAYVGKWAYRLSWCGNDPEFTDEVPVVLTADKLVGYENECRFKKVVADADGWSVEAMCESEGRTYRDAFHLRVQGDRLTQRAGGRSTTWQRCTPAASRPKAQKASTNQERIAAGQSLRREFARQCPERHLEWLDGATELRGFAEYGRDLSASGRSALVDAASPDFSKCQAGVDCQSSAYVVAIHRLGWAAAAAHSFCRRSRLTCMEPYGCSAGRSGASEAAGRETRWGGAVAAASKAPAPVVLGACRFPELLNREVQQEANRAIAKVGLDRDAAPEKFVMTNLQFTLDTVADPKHLEIAFSNAEDVDKCFPFFKVKREQLRLEYAGLGTRHEAEQAGISARSIILECKFSSGRVIQSVVILPAQKKVRMWFADGGGSEWTSVDTSVDPVETRVEDGRAVVLSQGLQHVTFYDLPYEKSEGSCRRSQRTDWPPEHTAVVLRQPWDWRE